MSHATMSSDRSPRLPTEDARAAQLAGFSRATSVAALASTCGLIALCLAWELWLAPTGRGTLALKALPLVPALIGLMRDRLYTHRWVSLMVWLYVAEGAVRCATEHGTSRWMAASELVLATVLFAACAWHVRVRLAIARMEPAVPAAA